MIRKIIGGHLLRMLLGRAIICLTVLLALILTAPWLSFIEVRTLDFLLALRPAHNSALNVEIVDRGSDPGLFDSYKDPHTKGSDTCEYSRLAYAEAVHRLKRWDAKVIVFDMMFSRSCKYEDKQFAEAIQDAGNVIVAATASTIPGAVKLEDPVDPICTAVWGIGSPVIHQPNETVHSVPLLVRDRDTGIEYPALCLAAFQCFENDNNTDVKIEQGRWLDVAGEKVPVLSGEKIHLLGSDAASEEEKPSNNAPDSIEVVKGANVKEIPKSSSWNTMMINWVGSKGAIRSHQLIDLLTLNDTEGRKLYKDKAVIIGQIDWDEHWTAMGLMAGPEIQANSLQTLIDGKFIKPVSFWTLMVLLTIFSLSTTSAIRRFRGIRAVGITVVLLLLAVLIARESLVRTGTWIYLFYCELGILLTFGITVVSESEKVTTMLARFIPSFIGRPETAITKEPRLLTASLLFSDIRGFTSTAEQLAPLDMMKMLITYQSSVEDSITKFGGTIVKTPGDAVLAVFWKCTGNRDHSLCALLAAKEIIDDLPKMAKDWETRGVQLKIGVGVNAGEIAMGLVGKRHLEPTVIGDPVNASQRLESLTKTMNCPLIFSESVNDRLDGSIETVFLDDVTVAGRKNSLKIYTLPGLCEKMEMPDHT